MRDDHGFETMADNAYLFAGGLTTGLNLATGILHILVAKGVLTKDDARWVIETAAESSAKAPLPEAHANTIADCYDAIHAQFAD